MSETMWQVLDLARDGLPLDHDIQGDRIRWGGRLQVILNLQHHGLLDDENKITAAGLDAFVPMIRKRPDNLNPNRRDKCLACHSRSCYLRFYTTDGTFDELACLAHEAALRERVAQLDSNVPIAQESRFRLKRAKRTMQSAAR